MSPYLISGTGIWVDLDTVQSITEPSPRAYDECLVSWDWAERAVIRWQHAFRYDLSFAEVRIDYSCEMEDGDPNTAMPLMGADGRTLFRARVEDQIFKPFFEAWVASGAHS